MKKELIKKLAGELIDYYADAQDSEKTLINAGITPTPELMGIIAESKVGWDALPCDEEGPTAQQDRAMDDFAKKTAKEIINLI